MECTAVPLHKTLLLMIVLITGKREKKEENEDL